MVLNLEKKKEMGRRIKNGGRNNETTNLIRSLSLLYFLFIFIINRGIFGSEILKGRLKILFQQKVPKHVIDPTKITFSVMLSI